MCWRDFGSELWRRMVGILTQRAPRTRRRAGQEIVAAGGRRLGGETMIGDGV